jgi:hypothetical protein
MYIIGQKEGVIDTTLVLAYMHDPVTETEKFILSFAVSEERDNLPSSGLQKCAN